MKTKVCIKCDDEKLTNEFNKSKTNKDGYINTCKSCCRNYSKIHYKMNKEEVKEKQKEHYKHNKNKVKEKQKIRYEKSKEEIRKQHREYYKINKDKINEKHKEYREKNKEQLKTYHNKNKEKAKNYQKKYRQLNKKELREKRRLYEKEVIGKNLLLKLAKNIRRRMLLAFKRNNCTKKSRTHEILGCSFEFLKHYIESLWELWMNWDNHGLYNGEKDYGWDIDHIIPLDNAKTEDELIKLCHYTNLQPLCSYINRYIKKSNINFVK